MSKKSATKKNLKDAIKNRALPPAVELALAEGVKEAVQIVKDGKKTSKFKIELPSSGGKDGLVLKVKVQRKD